MSTFLVSLLVFGAAFAAMAIGALRGRPLGARGCGDCSKRLLRGRECHADRE